MRKKLRPLLVVMGFLAGLAVVSSSLTCFYVREDGGGQLLWNGTEAYLFAKVIQRGYHFSILRYPEEIAKEWFGAPPLPSDQRVSLNVIRVSASGIERHLAATGDDPSEVPDLLTPIGTKIYANCGGKVCEWQGDHFRTLSAQEERSLGGFKVLIPNPNPKDGWHTTLVGESARNSQSTVNLNDGTLLKINQGDTYKSTTYTATVELFRNGQPPLTIWHLNGHPRRVGRTEYEKDFQNR